METKFEITMTTGIMYRFLLYHEYHGFGGKFSIVAGLALLLYYAVNRSDGTNNVWICLVFGILFLVYQPWTLFTRAAKQVKLNGVFKKPLAYTVSEEGVTVEQGEASSQFSWNDVYKVRETGQSILVYTGKRNAYIWVKEQMGVQEAEIRSMLRQYVPEKSLKLKKKQ